MASKFMTALGLGAALAAGLAFAPAAFAKDWKTVVIGMEGAYEPWNLTDSSGKIVGFEPDLVMDLCKRAGLECKIIAQDWDGMIPGLKAGKFDVIMDGMSITDERKKEIDFSKPYAVSPGAFLAPKDSPLAKAPDAGKLVNLDKDAAAGEAAIKGVQAALKGKTLGVQVSTTHAEFRQPVSEGRRGRQGIQDRRRPRSRPQVGPHRRVARRLYRHGRDGLQAGRQRTRDRRAEIHRRRVRRRHGHGHPQDGCGPDREVRQGAGRRRSPTAR